MEQNNFGNNLSRRYLGDDGYWYLFCRSCGKHRVETEFYNKKGSLYGKSPRCKLHFNKRDEDDDKSMDYLKLNPLTEDDFKGARDVLTKMGYDFDSELTIHQQFMKKHGLDEKKK